uniref:Ovomacroglobulin (Fragments) n=1 Tax=Gallus gallus TaxID=9031 RepID=Q9PSS0_CHICK
ALTSGLGPDVYQFLQDMGMKFFTNSKIRQPTVCTRETVRPPSYFLNAGFTASTHHVKLSAEVAREERGKRHILETIREFFPETWIWDIILINSTGKASVSYTIPDTITEWKASAFCVLPPNVVEESARASVSVLGDILGSAMQNTQNLLQMPYGCGEQNMVLFAPNIYVLDYLNETQQLSEDMKSKTIGYLESGYQKQLSYKHPDGSY